ncbi:MAG: hypothetical protein HY053_04785 [Proteobacteria bacterium]|nr:hypothetical protein [Pseudomonadota bacterium]
MIKLLNPECYMAGYKYKGIISEKAECLLNAGERGRSLKLMYIGPTTEAGLDFQEFRDNSQGVTATVWEDENSISIAFKKQLPDGYREAFHIHDTGVLKNGEKIGSELTTEDLRKIAPTPDENGHKIKEGDFAIIRKREQGVEIDGIPTDQHKEITRDAFGCKADI